MKERSYFYPGGFLVSKYEPLSNDSLTLSQVSVLLLMQGRRNDESKTVTFQKYSSGLESESVYVYTVLF